MIYTVKCLAVIVEPSTLAMMRSKFVSIVHVACHVISSKGAEKHIATSMYMKHGQQIELYFVSKKELDFHVKNAQLIWIKLSLGKSIAYTSLISYFSAQ